MRCTTIRSWMLLSLVLIAVADAADSLGEPNSKSLEPTTFSDDFQTDSRSAYAIEGPVRWERGKLTLGPDALIGRKLTAGATASFTLQLEWPALTEDGRQSETRVVFDLYGARESSVRVSRKRENGKETARVQIVDSHLDRQKQQLVTKVVRQFSLDGGASNGDWAIGYRYGLVTVAVQGRTVGVAYINNGATPVGAWRIEQDAGRVTLAALLLTANPAPLPPTPRQRQQRAEAKKLDARESRLHREGRYREAAAIRRTSHEIRRQVFGEQHPSFAISLNSLAARYYSMGEYARAKPLYVQAKEIARKVLGEEHPVHAGALNNLALLRHSMGDYAEAEQLYLQSKEIYLKVLGEEDPDYATCLNNLALFYHAIGDYTKAQPLYVQAMEIRRKVVGEEHPDFATSLSSLARLYYTMGEYAKAERLFVQARQIYLKVLGTEHPDYAMSLNNLAALYYSMGEYAKAEPLYVQAKEIYLKVLGEEHPSYANSLNNLAALYYSMGDYAKAEPLYLQAKEIRQKVLGEDHTVYVGTLNNLASLYHAMGDDAKAESLYLQAKEIWRKVLGEEHPDYATSLNNLALLYCSMGEYAKAEPLYVQAKEIRRKILGEKHPDYATSLNSLGLLYDAMGDYAKAEPLYVQAKEIRRKVLGEEHPDYAGSLTSLALLYQSMGAYAKAEPLLVQAEKIERKVLGEEHGDYAVSLNNLGSLYQSMSEYARAERYLLQAKEIFRKLSNEEHSDSARSLINLALLYKSTGQYAKAEPLYVQAKETLRKVLGDGHPDYAQSLNNLAFLYYAMGDHSKAGATFRQALDSRLGFAEKSLGWLSEARAMAFLQKGEIGRDPLLTVLRNQPQRDPTEAYSPVWQTRSLVTRTLWQRRLNLRESPQAETLYQRLRTTGQQLAQLTLAVPEPGQGTARRKRLAELNDEKEELETRLAGLSQEYGRAQQINQSTIHDLARQLPKDTALVDIIRAAVWNRHPEKKGKLQSERHYEAFVLRRSDNDRGFTVAWVHLGPAASIDQAIGQWRTTIKRTTEQGRLGPSDNRRDDSPPQRLRSSIWEKLESHLSGCRRVIIVPDGDLTRVPWAALPGRLPGSYLIEDYALATANSGQQLYGQLTDPSVAGDRLLLLGDVAYGKRLSEMPLASAGDRSPAMRGPAADQLPQWPFLEGTAAEVEAVRALYHDSSQAQVLEGAEANEYRLRQTMPAARFVHLATHGFFADEKYRSMYHHDPQGEQLFGRGIPFLGGPQRLLTARLAGVTVRNPLILSGVVLAGANLPPQTDRLGLPTGEDGILTAEEVVHLDLHKTELVVLSACETGLGTVAGGEGILGLQRAFGLAGARTTIASLWKVDDDATRTLMIEFYSNLWEQNLGKLEALRQAQLTMLRQYDPKAGRLRGPGAVRPVDPARLEAAREPEGERREPLPPLYWAAFVLSGDWR